MIPDFDAATGYLPAGEYFTTWQELFDRYGYTPWRRRLLDGLLEALQLLQAAGCGRAYLDGSEEVTMITNQRQYLNTQAQAERFRRALATPDPEGLHPKAAKAMRDGLRSQLEDLEAELTEYDALHLGQVTTLEAESIVGIGEALIKARIVRNLTQKDLAERLSLAEQQIQRYEATQYRGVAAERLQQVADALKLRVHEVFTLEQI